MQTGVTHRLPDFLRGGSFAIAWGYESGGPRFTWRFAGQTTRQRVPAGSPGTFYSDQKLTRNRLITPLTSPFRLLSTRRWPQKYSMPTSANGTGFQIRLTSVAISSLFSPQPAAPENLAAPEQTKPKAPPRLLMSWCRMPKPTFDRSTGFHQCW